MSTVSIRQQIRDLIISELNAAPPSGVPQASTRRWVPGQRLTSPRLAVFFGPAEGVSHHGPGFPIDDRELMIAIQAAVAVQDPAGADDAVEPMLVHVASVLGDTKLGGLITHLEEVSTEWASGQADLFYHAGLTRYRVRFQTKRGNLAAKQ